MPPKKPARSPKKKQPRKPAKPRSERLAAELAKFETERETAAAKIENENLKALRERSGPEVSGIIGARIEALENPPCGTAPTHSAPEDADRECAFLHVELCHDKILTLAEKHQSKLPGAGFHLDRVAIAFLTSPPARETLMQSKCNYEFSVQLDEAVRSRLLDALGSAAPCVISGEPGTLMEPFASNPGALTSFAILQIGIGREELRGFLRDLAARWQALQLPADFNPFQDGGNDSEHLNQSFRECYLLPAVAVVGRTPAKVIAELARMSEKAHRRKFLDAPWTVPTKKPTKFEARPHLKGKADPIRRLKQNQKSNRASSAEAANYARLRLHKRISKMISRYCPPATAHPKPA
jgi:hypothetical protein